MNKKIFYALLPFCVSLLTGCDKTYTLTLVNTDESCGTIITEGGKFKAGQQVKIETELIHGYVVKKWEDEHGNKIGSRKNFQFLMPNKDTTLTVYYDFDKFELNHEQKIVSTGDYYDFSDINLGRSLIHYSLDEEDCWGYDVTTEKKWHDQVNIMVHETLLDDILDYKGFYDQDNNFLGKENATFEMPNYDYSINPVFESKCHGLITTSNSNSAFDFEHVGSYNRKFSLSGYNCWANIYLFDDENAQSVTLRFDHPSLVFEYWYDLDNDCILTYETTYTFTNLKTIRHIQAIGHMNH